MIQRSITTAVEALHRAVCQEIANWESFLGNPQYVPRPMSHVDFSKVDEGLSLAEKVSNEEEKQTIVTQFSDLKDTLNKIKTDLSNKKFPAPEKKDFVDNAGPPNSVDDDKKDSVNNSVPPKSVYDDSDRVTNLLSERAFETVANALAKSRLPTMEQMVFDGEPLDYVGWKADIDSIFAMATFASAEKSRILIKYVTGPAKEAIKGLSILLSPQAFDRAIETLEQRFGDPISIAESFRHRLHDLPQMGSNPGHDLRRFSDFLAQCAFAQEWLPTLKSLDDAHIIHSLAGKLPSWVFRNWQRKAVGEKGLGKYLPFFIFNDFVRTEANILEHPILRSLEGQTLTTPEPKDKRQTNVRSTETKERTCLKCSSGEHPT